MSANNSAYSNFTSLSSVTDENSVQEETKETADDNAVYETQYLGFTPKSFYNGIYNAVSEYIFEAIATVESVMQEECHDIMPKNEIEGAMSRLKPHVVKTIDRAFDKLEIYLDENIFHIPHNIVLPEDKIQVTQPVTGKEMHALDKEVEELRNKIMAVKYANMCIANDIRETDQAQAKISNMLKKMKTLRSIVRTAGISDLKDSLIHCTSQLNTLIKDIREIQSELNEIKSESFVETQAKKCKLDDDLI